MGDGPVYLAPKGAGPQPALAAGAAQAPRQYAGMMFVTVVNPTNLVGAASVQDSWTKFLAADDHVVSVGEPGCEGDTAIGSGVMLPPDWLSGMPGYRRAQLKHAFGAVFAARELERRGAAVWPRWWFLKDDDTYVNSFNLKAALAPYDPSTTIIVGSAEGPGNYYMNGGSGLAFSWRLVEQLLAKDQGQRFLVDRANDIASEKANWDYYMPVAIQRKFAPDLKLFDDVHFEHCLENCGAPLVQRGKKGERNDTWCHAVPGLCTCARSDAPASWHLRGFPHEHQFRLEQLEAYENRTRKGDQR